VLLILAQAIAPASTWATCDVRCDALAVLDVDRDGFDDVCVRLEHTWLVAPTVSGWKASPWKPAEALRAGISGELEAATNHRTHFLQPAPPPYEPGAEHRARDRGDIDGDGDVDLIGLYRCSRPGEFGEIRVSFRPGPDPGDRDGDGLSEFDEARLGCDPLDRDSDRDGLLDGWEVHGLPRGVDTGGAALDPTRSDVICAVAPYEGVDAAKLKAELERAAALYSAIGVRLHARIDPFVPPADQCGGDWAACGARRFPAKERGFLHWMQVTPWGGGQAQQTGDMGGCGLGAAVFAHEFGHQLSLSHEGDSGPAWCPLYPSLMNYAFNYSLGGEPDAVRFSTGELRAVELREAELSERLPFPFEKVAYLAAPPFRFTLEPAGESATRIDWNHDGAYSEETVSADVNYGGSTGCGIRRDLGGLTIGAAPALSYVGGQCWLATLDPTQATISVRAYLGDERWAEPRALPSSATNEDPLLVGAWGRGWVFLRRPTGWLVSSFDAAEAKEPAEVAGLPNLELSVLAVGERLLLVTRSSDDALDAYWLDGHERLEVAPAGRLEVRSSVPVGLGLDPRDGRIVIAGAQANSRGATACLRVSWLRLEGDALVHDETRWVRGEASGTHCTTRPAVAFDAAGQLNVFHTGLPQGDGQMTAWRTRRVGNLALDEGWLTCLLYDVWTRTRRPVAFANGPQGALYAFRWDAAEAHGMRVNELLLAHNGFGIDPEPMRDFDDGAKIREHGLAHSILWMQPDAP
jgi:hypothetical protein